MNPRIFTAFACLCLALAALRPSPATAQQPYQPSVDPSVLRGSDRVEPHTPPASEPDTASLQLEIVHEPDGSFVSYPQLLRMVRAVDPNAQGQWDNLLGVFRIDTLGRSIQGLSNRSVLIIDGRYQPVDQPVRIRDGVVLVPLATVHRLFDALGIELGIDEPEPSAPMPIDETMIPDGAPDAATSTLPGVDPAAVADTATTQTSPTAQAPPGSPDPAFSPTPFDEATARPTLERAMPRTNRPQQSTSPAPARLRTGRPDPASPNESLFSRVERAGLGPIEGAPLGSQIAGLSWAELADSNHRRPLERIAVVYDAPLDGLAAKVEELLRRGLGVQTYGLAIEDRDQLKPLIGQIAQLGPDLVIELAALNDPGARASDFEIWAVHEALWPGETPVSARDVRSVDRLYAVHQFHNLALGSMLRRELSQAYPAGSIRYMLTPSWLLRRVDAPSVAVFAAQHPMQRDSDETDRAARAIAAGVIAYAMGIQSAVR